VGKRGFYARYYAIRDATPGYDSEFVSAEDVVIDEASDEELVLRLVPLCMPGENVASSRVTVNHSMLLFLLGLEDVWRDLRVVSERASQRDAVVLLCQAVYDMFQAHERRWPGYEWTPAQKRVVGWCDEIASQRAGPREHVQYVERPRAGK